MCAGAGDEGSSSCGKLRALQGLAVRGEEAGERAGPAGLQQRIASCACPPITGASSARTSQCSSALLMHPQLVYEVEQMYMHYQDVLSSTMHALSAAKRPAPP